MKFKTDKEILMAHAELFIPNREELLSLKTHEPLIQFEILPPKGISEGRQSRVSILEYSVEGVSRRVIWKRMGVGKNLTESEAKILQSRLAPYRGELVGSGWNIPEIYHSQIVPVSSEFQIFSYEQYIPGGDGQLMVENPDEPQFLKWMLLRKVIESLASYSDIGEIEVQGEKLSGLPQGLDLKLANIVVERETGKMFFVDLFGPKEIKDGKWLTYSKKLDSLSESNLMAIAASREGMILRLYRLIEQKWAESGGITQERLRKNLFHLLDNSSLPKKEVLLIKREIGENFPWLDKIYSERQI